jgi:hypothetical protein
MARLPDADGSCGEHYCFRDFFEAGETWACHRPPNVPQQPGTYAAIERLCRDILDPVARHFGRPDLTYGFASRGFGA